MHTFNVEFVDGTTGTQEVDAYGNVTAVKDSAGQLSNQSYRVTSDMSGIAWDTPPFVIPVPQSVSPFQARAALLAAGLLATVEAAVEAHPDPKVKLVFEYAMIWERHSQFITDLGGALGLTAEQIDDLFIAAAAY